MTNSQVVDTSAVAAIASPLWLPALHTASELAALVLPILGATWLILQIGLRIYGAYRGRPK
jgi:hypothetical protein